MWKDAYLEGKVMAATPLELVSMLYEHALRALEDARRSLAAGDIEARAKAINKTIAIISELHGSLNHEAGGEISAQLASLYSYMSYRLTIGNLQQKAEPLEEVEKLMRTLAEAWDTISHPAEPRHADTAEQIGPATRKIAFLGQGESQASAGSWSA